MSQKLQPVRGTHDILPEENRLRRHVISPWEAVMESYHFEPISTPIFEFTDVFHRTLGDTSDVVTKETYTFTDRGGESITLRPEFTAPVVRAFISNGLQQEIPIRWYYHGPAFRYERPQKGRLRQFHQIGAELLGVAGPEGDIEMISMAAHGLKNLGFMEHCKLEINTLGDAESRQRYRATLVDYFKAHMQTLSEVSRERLEKNPLRILDSKEAEDRAVVANAPTLQDFLTPEANAFFDKVKAGLTLLEIPFTLSPRLVRGLDYYNHTVFEFTTNKLGAQGTVLAGGRYDGLVKQMGGPDIPGVGWAAGIERMCELASRWKDGKLDPLVVVIPISEACEAVAWKAANSLREMSMVTELLLTGNVGKRMKRADKINATVAVLIGEEELARGECTLKNLRTGEQKTVPQTALIDEIYAIQPTVDLVPE